MGVYLSSPITDKDSIDQKCDSFVYGASSMQGWRITQEDAHNCIPYFNDSPKTSFFAVYDGHGGAEVAKYCEKHFPEFVKELMSKQDGLGPDIKAFIQLAFLSFDALLTQDDVIKELKELAGKDDDLDEEEEGDPVGRTETDMLKEEANMPLDQLLAQYKGSTTEDLKNAHKKEYKSPFLSALRRPFKGQRKDEENGDISSQPEPSASDSTEEDKSEILPNGLEDNVNNSYESVGVDNTNKCALDNQKDNVAENNNEKSSGDSNKKETDTNCEESAGESSTGCGSSSTPGGYNSKAGGSSSKADSSNEAEPSGSGSSCQGIRKSKAKAAAEMAKVDGEIDTSDDDDDDDEDDDDEEMWEDMSDDDDDEEEEEGQDDDVPMMDVSNEEPGSDSGCTACVCLLQDNKLIVANAGDSRCVLARGGEAVELSFDHKPEDDVEKTRIEKAGGKVTSDGRVNGGLNLSRAIGDHVYKRNKDLPAKEQMITALPDVETVELCPEDQFFVIACDGIWNYMSSQDVVDYVLEKLKDPEKREKPSLICEELFDHCLAPNTFGDGTGCDNMTCVIVVLDTFKPTNTAKAPASPAATMQETAEKVEEGAPLQDSLDSKKVEQDPVSLKRTSDNQDANEGKRMKLGGEELF